MHQIVVVRIDGHWRNCVYCHEKGETASHSFEMHEQTAATCVSKAVYARVCSDCDYHGGNFIFGNINPDNHDLIPHAGKAATCTESGWEAYDTCKRCRSWLFGSISPLSKVLGVW